MFKEDETNNNFSNEKNIQSLRTASLKKNPWMTIEILPFLECTNINTIKYNRFDIQPPACLKKRRKKFVTLINYISRD